KRALPSSHVTLFALKSDATPPVICLTTCAFHSFALAKSSWGSAAVTPSFGLISRAAWSACAVETQAFVGMQPTRRQVPPSSLSRSTHTTRAPSCAARIAAVYPPGPPPRTATSHSIRLSSLVDPLQQLQPFPVRVEHVDEPHLAVQLEHDADLDARAAQS